jgi:hypothetical protein
MFMVYLSYRIYFVQVQELFLRLAQEWGVLTLDAQALWKDKAIAAFESQAECEVPPSKKNRAPKKKAKEGGVGPLETMPQIQERILEILKAGDREVLSVRAVRALLVASCNEDYLDKHKKAIKKFIKETVVKLEQLGEGRP